MSYTVQEIRERRFTRDRDRVTSTAMRLAFERQEIKDEYRKVSATYAKHLERLNKKMEKNLTGWQELSVIATKLAEDR